MKIFALDSSEKSAGVAIMDGSSLVGEYYSHTGFTHSQTLMPMVDSLFRQTNIAIEDIDLFSVCVGPGSFTGIRIGLASVKGMAVVLNKPCLGVSSLEALAYNCLSLKGIVCSVIDARQNNVYNAIFEVSDGSCNRLSQDRVIDIDELSTELHDRYRDYGIFLVGSGSELCYGKFKDKLNELYLVNESLRYIRASSVAYIAKERFAENEFLDVNNVTPVYLRVSQAERNLSKNLIK